MRTGTTSPRRYIALSRDLLTRWGGQFSFGDTVELQGTDVDGIYVVQDIMNKRFRRHVDVLIGSKSKLYKKWYNVKLIRK